METTQQDLIKFVIYGRDDKEIAMIEKKGKETKVTIHEKAKTSNETAIRKYINIIEASLDLSDGTYTGTIAPTDI